jgi:hypothetical protein
MPLTETVTGVESCPVCGVLESLRDSRVLLLRRRVRLIAYFFHFIMFSAKSPRPTYPKNKPTHDP